VVSVRSTGRVEYLKNNAGVFGLDGTTNDVVSAPPASGGARGISIADVNEDGKPDIVVANEYARSVSVLRNISEWFTDPQ
jgi:hypothetical protein